MQDRHRATSPAVKWLVLVALTCAEISCTTLANRRDLYSPEPGPGSYERQKQLAGTSRTTTTTTMTTAPAPEEGPLPRPDFR